MPLVWEQDEDKVIAIVCSDIHLSLTPPRARREEPDWFKAMKRPLDELAELSSYYDAPILCAGDIFNHWREEPALVNFALKYLPSMYAIPGQHDLPLHNIDLIEKSAFWTLALAEKIVPIIQEEPIVLENDIILHAFPWGRELTPLKQPAVKGKHHIALVHSFFWMEGHSYKVASKKEHASQFKNKVKGYHSVVFGDNHQGFTTELNGVPVINCGTLMRRNSDEKEYAPKIGLLCRSGNIMVHRCSLKNEHLKTVEEDLSGSHSQAVGDMADFLNGLKDAQTKSFDYAEAVEFLMDKYSVSISVRKNLLEALGRG